MMPIDIPMPRDPSAILQHGFASINDIIQKSRLAAAERERMQEMKRQFEENLKIRKMQQERAAQNAAMQRQLYAEQIRAAHNRNDPSWAAEQMRRKFEVYNTLKNQFNPEDFRNNPALRGGFKKEFGFDPLVTENSGPEEAAAKERAKLEARTAYEQEKENRKATELIHADVKPVMRAVGEIKRIEDALSKHPNATGKYSAMFKDVPLINKFIDKETLGTINSASTKLQAALAHQLGSRGGQGVAKIAETAKPSANKSLEENIGLLQENKAAFLEALQDMKVDYEQLNPGKKFPYKIPAFLTKNPFEKKSKWVRVLNNETGKEEVILREDAERGG